MQRMLDQEFSPDHAQPKRDEVLRIHYPDGALGDRSDKRCDNANDQRNHRQDGERPRRAGGGAHADEMNAPERRHCPRETDQRDSPLRPVLAGTKGTEQQHGQRDPQRQKPTADASDRRQYEDTEARS